MLETKLSCSRRPFFSVFVYENNWQAENLEKLEARIQSCLKKISFVTVKALFESTRTRVGELRVNGVVEAKPTNIKQ